MPKLNDLENFKDRLFRLSGEPEWRAQKGELFAPESLSENSLGSEDGNSLQNNLDTKEEEYEDDHEEIEKTVAEQVNNESLVENKSVSDTDIDFDKLPDIDEDMDFGKLPDIDEDMDFDQLPDIDEDMDFGKLPDIDEDMDFDQLPDIDDLINFDQLPDIGEPIGVAETKKSENLNKKVLQESPLEGLEESGSFFSEEEDGVFESDDNETEEVQEFDNDGDLLYFNDSDVDIVEQVLESFPRNLRITLEEILSSPETPDAAIKMFVDKILTGASLRSITDDVRAVTGRTIVIPLFYQKRRGKNLDRNHYSFSYLFKTWAWPVLKRVFLFSVLTSCLMVLLFHFLYRPVIASYYYRNGYKKIKEGKYNAAEDSFNKAFSGWKLGFIHAKGIRKQYWFYKYADLYIQKRQLKKTVEKYKQLLQYYPNSKKAYLEYAFFEKDFSGNYEDVDRILTHYLTNIDPSDSDVLIAKGDNLFEWGALTKGKTEEARRVYADLQYKLGSINVKLGMRFLRYAIRTNNHQEVERWANYFNMLLERKRKVSIDPLTFAELAGWHLDRNETGLAKQVLDVSMDTVPNHIEVLYQMARYYSYGGMSNFQEEQMLERTYYELLQKRELTWREESILIDVYRRFGLIYMKQKNDKKAEQYFSKAVQTYENAVKVKVLIPKEEFGSIYNDFGSLYYGEENYTFALFYMNKALENFYDTPELRYNLGYSYSEQKNYSDALSSFYFSFENAQSNINVLFSYATTLAKIGNGAASEGVYQKLSLELERQRQGLDGSSFMTPNRRKKIMDLLCKTYNNLGVVRYQLSRSSRESSRYSTLAKINLGQAVVYWDELTRMPDTKIRSTERGLPQENFQAITNYSPDPGLKLFDNLSREFD